MASTGNSVPTAPVHRVNTEAPLLNDLDDGEEVKLPTEIMRQGANLTLQQETHPPQVEKRGRGRPAYRPLDLPPSKPLRKASASSGDSEPSQPRARPKQVRMEQFLPQ